MKLIEGYKRDLAELERRHSWLLRSGQLVTAMNVASEITKIRKMIAEEEERRRPKPVTELISGEELRASNLIPLLIETYLAMDYVNDCVYNVIDSANKMGLDIVHIAPELSDIKEKSQTFASFLCKQSQFLSDLMTDNEFLIAALHKKTRSYIEQRSKNEQKKQGSTKQIQEPK